MNEWNRALKIAITNGSIEEIAALYGSVPTQFDTLEEGQESAALIAEAIALLKAQRNHLEAEMVSARAAISYQKQQTATDRSRLDLKE